MGTSTRSFGTSRREGHDASAFYDRRLAAVAFSDDAVVADVPRRSLDRIYHHSSETMDELPDNSVALMVTSPPYHAGKDFDSDATYPEFLELLGAVFAQVQRVLDRAGGRRSTWPTWGASRTCPSATTSPGSWAGSGSTCGGR